MPRRLRIHVPGGFYHVTLRGNHRQPVFRCDADRGLLNLIVARAIEKYDARLHVMQSRMESNGHFFERRYHATLVEATDYLFTALHYIHRNPLEAGIVEDVDQYPWSSHHAYVGRRRESWLTSSFILGKFAPDARAASRAYEAFIKLDRRDLASPFPEGAFIFGSDEFVDRIRGANPRARASQNLQALIDEACARFLVERELLSSRARSRLLTKVRAWIAHQAGIRGIAGRSEVARALGRSEGTLRSAVLSYPDEIE